MRLHYLEALNARSIVPPLPPFAPKPILAPDDVPDPMGRAVAAALALHAALGIVLLTLPPSRLPRPPREDSITVEIVAPETSSQRDMPRITTPLTASRAVPRSPNEADRLTPATQFYSGALLADPRSREAREALPRLAPDERIVQLCDIEALGQIQTVSNAHFEPDIVVPYATAEIKLANRTMNADGGAFRSQGRWFGVRFACTVARDLAKIVSFALRIGDPIPQQEWASHNLAAGSEPSD